MAIPPQKFREAVLQILYSSELSVLNDHAMIDLMMKELKITKKTARLACEKARATLDRGDEIDRLITQTSKSYEFDRIQKVEKNILRLGVYEILYDEAIPEKVAISEAIRLARKFSTPEAATFINALLDHIYKTKTGQSADTAPLEDSIEGLILSEEEAERASKEQPISEEDD